MLSIIYFCGILTLAFAAMVAYNLGYDIFGVQHDQDGRGVMGAIVILALWPIVLPLLAVGFGFTLAVSILFGASKITADLIKKGFTK